MPDPAPLSPDRTFLIEIDQWECPLWLSVGDPAIPARHLFQRGLMYSCSLCITGRVRAPTPHRGKRIGIFIELFDRKARFNAKTSNLGTFRSSPLDERGPSFDAFLKMPEKALAPAVTCLATRWKFIDINVADPDAAETTVRRFEFSSAIDPAFAKWAGPELAPSH